MKKFKFREISLFKLFPFLGLIPLLIVVVDMHFTMEQMTRDIIVLNDIFIETIDRGIENNELKTHSEYMEHLKEVGISIYYTSDEKLYGYTDISEIFSRIERLREMPGWYRPHSIYIATISSIFMILLHAVFSALQQAKTLQNITNEEESEKWRDQKDD